MIDSMGRAIKKVDSFMDKDGVVQTQLNWFEAKTRVKKRYILAGCLILMGWLMFGLLAPFVVSLVSFVYPAIQSVKGKFYQWLNRGPSINLVQRENPKGYASKNGKTK